MVSGLCVPQALIIMLWSSPTVRGGLVLGPPCMPKSIEAEVRYGPPSVFLGSASLEIHG